MSPQLSAHSPRLCRARAGWAEYGYCARHSRFFWGLRLHLLCILHGLPVGFAVTGKADERQTLLGILNTDPALTGAGRRGQILIADRNYYGRKIEATLAQARGGAAAPGPQGRSAPSGHRSI